jgi:hypothetical protein
MRVATPQIPQQHAGRESPSNRHMAELHSLLQQEQPTHNCVIYCYAAKLDKLFHYLKCKQLPIGYVASLHVK